MWAPIHDALDRLEGTSDRAAYRSAASRSYYGALQRLNGIYRSSLDAPKYGYALGRASDEKWDDEKMAHEYFPNDPGGGGHLMWGNRPNTLMVSGVPGWPKTQYAPTPTHILGIVAYNLNVANYAYFPAVLYV